MRRLKRKGCMHGLRSVYRGTSGRLEWRAMGRATPADSAIRNLLGTIAESWRILVHDAPEVKEGIMGAP